jgi:hypothetical protein
MSNFREKERGYLRDIHELESILQNQVKWQEYEDAAIIYDTLKEYHKNYIQDALKDKSFVMYNMNLDGILHKYNITRPKGRPLLQ